MLNSSFRCYLKALELKRKGFKDLIDLILYTTSLFTGIMFLTRDELLIRFLEDNDEETKNIFLRKISERF